MEEFRIYLKTFSKSTSMSINTIECVLCLVWVEWTSSQQCGLLAYASWHGRLVFSRLSACLAHYLVSEVFYNYPNIEHLCLYGRTPFCFEPSTQSSICITHCTVNKMYTLGRPCVYVYIGTPTHGV